MSFIVGGRRPTPTIQECNNRTDQPYPIVSNLTDHRSNGVKIPMKRPKERGVHRIEADDTFRCTNAQNAPSGSFNRNASTRVDRFVTFALKKWLCALLVFAMGAKLRFWTKNEEQKWMRDAHKTSPCRK